ncbi:hypothetical protein EKH79_17190 [Dyella dinghuensis]|uniref:Uncharacterized protein n=1 Tax=Dyella dinghuensis TaxID=1920169 RepID=A0A3S0S1A0_9GAMM|nr:hypothetical protein [Dyella dinghuensis]RUL61374.1 hypothetical protein EKH79_17190 [Dyella dinghuensis]
MCRCAPVLANDEPNDSHLGAGIHDVTDPELADMRGRYVVGDNTVVYFGVEMITTFQSNTGQTLQGTLTIGMNFSKNSNSPQVTFVPTVTITTPNAPLPTASTVQSNVSRGIQSGGVANVGGFVQSVQIAGDNNAAANVTSLNIQNGGSAPNTSTTSNSSTTSSSSNDPSTPSVASVTSTGSMTNTNSSTSTTSPDNGGSNNSNNTSNTSNSTTSNSNSNNTAGNSNNLAGNTAPGTTTNTGAATPTGRTATVGGSSVSSTYSNNSAEVTASIDGQGTASQFMHPGSLGQEIQLATDNAVVTNQMIVNLVTQQLSSTEQLAHTLAQSLNLSHLNGH